MIVIVRLKPTGALGWITSARWLAEAGNSNRRNRNAPGAVPRPISGARAHPAARLENLARRLGTAAVGVTMCAVTAADGTVVVSYPPVKTPVFRADPRIARLEAFFDTFDCPWPRHVADYLRVADTYGIDYRILPALSVRESTCGLYEQMNNHWGWDNARSGFGSIPAGIDYIARQLAEAPQFKGKSLDQKLWTYNPIAAYPGEIKKLMRKIEE